MNINYSEMISQNDNYAKSAITKALFFVLGTYLLLIISAGLTILIGAGVIGLIYYISSTFFHRIPAGIILIIMMGMGIGVLSMLKGIAYSLKPKKSYQPAFILEKEKQNELIKFINELCNRMNTKVPDCILLHAEPTFFVQQGKISTFSGTAKGRILAIGMPLLDYLSENELRAILAHEFAHFTGRDTIYSSYVLPVYTSTITAITNMKNYNSNGENSGWLMLPMILPILILSAYYNKFYLSNMKRSREREKRADVIACQYCGCEDFKNALTKVVGISRIFSPNAENTILKTYKEGKLYINYYQYFRDHETNLVELFKMYRDTALNEKTGIYHSHPSLSDRLQYVPNIERKYSTNGGSINLIEDSEEYEKSLTSAYTEYLAIINGVTPST